jgi:phytoene/squalene synthetase
MAVAWIYIKKYWKYLLIILGALFVIAYYLFLRKKDDIVDPLKSSTKLADGLSEVKDKLTEVANTSTVEVAVAKAKHETVKEELADIAKEKDKVKRRGRLATLANRMRDDDDYNCITNIISIC